MEIVKNEREKGRKYINKLSVGERQLAAAIKMYFLEMDPLAIHTVSSAAHNILADLMKNRGKDASIHGFIVGLFSAAKDLHEGKINEEEISTWGDGEIELVKQYRSLFEVNPDFNIDGISSSAPPDYARLYWANRRRSYNYLKHADRDAREFLDESALNTEDTIFQAIACSQHLNMKVTTEKYFFYCAMIALGKLNNDDKQPFELALLMSGMPEEEIMALGRRFLRLASLQDDDILLGGIDPVLKAKTWPFE